MVFKGGSWVVGPPMIFFKSSQRHYTIDERAGLRDVDNDDWETVFSQYISDLSCPHADAGQSEILDWLLGCAIRLVYSEFIFNSGFCHNPSLQSPIIYQP